jgi:hypothetical protein
MGSSTSTAADHVVIYNHEQHKALERENGFPVYLLFIDLGSSVGGGFPPQTNRVLRKLAIQWGTAGTAMQHWAIMVDDCVYELARKREGSTAPDRGMHNNPNFKRPEAIPYYIWERERQVKEVKWRKYHYTKKTKLEITRIGKSFLQYHVLSLLLTFAFQPRK